MAFHPEARIPSGGSAGLAVEPQEAPKTPRVTTRRVVGVAGFAALLMLAIDEMVDAGHGHLGPIRIWETALADTIAPSPTLTTLLVVALHFVVSTLYAGLIAAIVVRMTARQSVTVGAIFGFVLYAWHFYGMTPFVPWLAAGRDVVNLSAHLVFGVVTATLLRARS
ncbi:MAG: hypothetical protein U0235_15220 [Polyangiaceae bacterium]